jgi:hypothetical protein
MWEIGDRVRCKVNLELAFDIIIASGDVYTVQRIPSGLNDFGLFMVAEIAGVFLAEDFDLVSKKVD